VTKNVIAPRRQARKERFLLISPNLGALCAFARDTIFPISSSIQNFKYLWLDLGKSDTDCPLITCLVTEIRDASQILGLELFGVAIYGLVVEAHK
jgi:hypothetical protein